LDHPVYPDHFQLYSSDAVATPVSDCCRWPL